FHEGALGGDAAPVSRQFYSAYVRRNYRPRDCRPRTRRARFLCPSPGQARRKADGTAPRTSAHRGGLQGTVEGFIKRAVNVGSQNKSARDQSSYPRKRVSRSFFPWIPGRASFRQLARNDA